MPLTKLQFKPGLNTEVTSYSNSSGWRDCDKIRFRFGFPEKLGGWLKYSTNTIVGTPRSLHAWSALDASEYMGIGTESKFYIEEGLVFNDVTPLRKTTTGAATFAAVNGSATITATDSSHGAIAGDYVTFSSAATLGGNITAAVLNQEYEILTIPTASTYTFTATATANSSDSGNGGGSTVAKYQINVGITTVVGGTGFGAGTFSRGTYGSPATTVVGGGSLRMWGQDNFGEDLVFNVYDGSVFYWDRSGSSAAFVRAVTLSSLGSSAPTISRQILVSDRDRHVIAIGCNALGVADQDKLLIRWSDQENATDWTPTADNTSGDLLIGNGSEIVRAVETRREVIIITDIGVHSMQFIGPPFTFGVNQITNGTTIRGPNAVVAVGDSVFWMGRDRFYSYDGQVKPLPCPVLDTIFQSFNDEQGDKVFTGSNSSFGEVIWFYPSAASTENDRYVVYNYSENVWYFGTIARTAWIDRGLKQYPIGASTTAYLYSHELGADDDGSAMTSYIESSPVDVDAGDQFLSLRRLIPDIDFSKSDDSAAKEAVFTIKSQRFPGSGFVGTSTSTVTDTTDQSDVRVRGRSFGLRVETTGLGVAWRLGSSRVEIRKDGMR
jgi:hypothetical protein